jgi:hypothetical protein
VRLTSHSTLQVVTAVPDFGNPERLRARFVQQLPRAFKVEPNSASVGFQSIPGELEPLARPGHGQPHVRHRDAAARRAHRRARR